MGLRPYQSDALSAVKSRLAAGVTRQLIALPTGTGKTVVFAMLPEFLNLGGKTLFLVHREELASQAAEKLMRWNPNISISVEMGDSWANSNSQFIVGSVPTLGRKGSKRLARFRPEDFSTIIVDECHHATADSYINIFDYFDVLNQNSKKLLVGFTATPNRGDGVALGKIFDEISFQMDIRTAIKEGWLVDIRGVRVRSKTSLDAVRTQAGDFQQGDLSNT